MLTTRERMHSPISIDEMLSEQAADEYCQWARREMDRHTQGVSPFAINQHGVLTRRSNLDGSLQVIVPVSLRQRLLQIAHNASTAGHPGRAKLYQTMRRAFYWPSMTVDIHHLVENCTSCAKNRIKEQKNVYPMRLFPATRPLEYVAMDILGPLPRTKHGMRFILVITDRFTKLTKTEALRTITSLAVAKAFCKTWVFNYGTPKILLTDNGTQFTASFFRNVCRILGIHKVFTTEYHPQTNGQAERFNRTIIAAIRNYVSDSQRDWDEWLGPITYAYNTQVHRSTGTTPFDLVLSRHPPPLLVEQEMLEHHSSERARDRRARMSQAKEEFLKRLGEVMAKARHNLEKTQLRYKRNFDARIRARLRNLHPGSFVYREIPVHPEGVNPKLASPVDGPHRVIANNWPTILIDDHGRAVRVNANRLTKAPTPPEYREDRQHGRSPPAPPTNARREQEPHATRHSTGSEQQTNTPELQQESVRETADSAHQPPRTIQQQAGRTTRGAPSSSSVTFGVPPTDITAAPPVKGTSTTTKKDAGPVPNLVSPPPSSLPPVVPRDAHRSVAPPPSPSHRDSVRKPPEKARPTRTQTRASKKTSKRPQRKSPRKATRDEPRYEIGGLVDAGVDKKGNELYKVRWAGYGPADDTWEPADNLPQSLIRDYKRTHGL